MGSEARRGAILFLAVVFLLTVSLVAAADSIKLKNGRVVKGQVVRYSNGEFLVLLPGGEARAETRDRMFVLVENIDTIEFDAAGATPPAAAGPSEKLVVLDASKDVVASGVQLRRGDKVRITASGELQFADGRVSGPKGLEQRESWPFPGERFGVLIALVGDPQSTLYHVIGESGEFEARRDGELFLQINARSLQGARGAYTARIQAPSVAAATPTPARAASAPASAASTGRQLRHQLDVAAERDWTDTGIDLQAGDTLRIKAEGTINYTSKKTCGPNGGDREWSDLLRPLPVKDVGRGALIGLVGQTGTATPFFIGASEEFKLEHDGRLFLGINDDDYRNNRGSFRVTVEIVPASGR